MMVFVMTISLFCGCKDSKQKGDSKQKEVTAQTQNTKSGNGRFFENEIPLPQDVKNIKAMRLLSDGSLGAVTEHENNTYYILKSSDSGQTWDKVKIKGIAKEYIPHAALSADGNAALFRYSKKGKITVTLAKADGKTDNITLAPPAVKGGDNQVRQGAYDDQGTLFVKMLDTIYTVKADGTLSKAFDTEGINISYFSMAGDILTGVHSDGIMLYDTKKKNILDRENVLDDIIKNDQSLSSADTDVGQPIVFSAEPGDDGILFANKNGIFHYTIGGSVAEQLMDSSMGSLGSGDAVFLDLAVQDKNNLFIAASIDGGDKIFQYTYDKNAASVPNKELSVYALDESVYLRKAVTLFQKEFPDIHVNLEIGLSGKDGVTLNDALTTLNTNILAGDGPDVLILDGMPTDSYIEKGLLEDISDIVKEVDDKEGLFANIVESCKKDGKVYAMPTRFLISAIQGKKAILDAGGTLESMTKKAVELAKNKKLPAGIPATPLKSARMHLRDYYYADSATWKKEDGSIDEKLLKDYLSHAKELYDADDHNSKLEKQMDSVYDNDTLSTGEKIGSLRGEELITGQTDYSYGTLSSIYDLQTICSIRAETKDDYCLMNHDKVKSFIPYLEAGVTKGGNTDTAKKFVSLLLEEKTQNSQSNGIPVNRKAFDAVCTEKMDAQNVKDQSSMGFSVSGSDKIFGYDYINLKQNDVDKFTEIVESLEKPSMTNRVIQEIILEQGVKYLHGEQDLDSTVDAILKKVNLYLAE